MIKLLLCYICSLFTFPKFFTNLTVFVILFVPFFKGWPLFEVFPSMTLWFVILFFYTKLSKAVTIIWKIQLNLYKAAMQKDNCNIKPQIRRVHPSSALTPCFPPRESTCAWALPEVSALLRCLCPRSLIFTLYLKTDLRLQKFRKVYF